MRGCLEHAMLRKQVKLNTHKTFRKFQIFKVGKFTGRLYMMLPSFRGANSKMKGLSMQS